MRAWLRYHWRLWRGLCVTCGGALEPIETVGGFDLYRLAWPLQCHTCSKRWGHGRNYGMGERKLQHG